jgi:ADP-ribose pyrophosphatase YjhB (NUDIX family)
MPAPFRYCPSCKSDKIIFSDNKRFFCPACGFEYFQNTAAAVAAFLEFKGKVLVVERNREPGIGMLDLPGGFADPMESADEALYRELYEELKVRPVSVKYLCSFPNKYHYKTIDYYTLDLFFIAELDTDTFTIEKEEIKNYRFVLPSELAPEDFSFASMKKAIGLYKEMK